MSKLITIVTIATIITISMSSMSFAQTNLLQQNIQIKPSTKSLQFLNKISYRPTTLRNKIVKINTNAFAHNRYRGNVKGKPYMNTFNISLFNNSKMEVVIDRVKYRTSNNYTLFGHIRNVEGNIRLTVLGDQIMGYLRVDENVYSIESLGDGTHVLIELDLSKLENNGCPSNGKGKANLSEDFEHSPQTEEDQQSAPMTAPGQNTLRIAVAFTAAAASHYANITLAAQAMVDQMNDAWSNSLVSHSGELVRVVEYNYNEDTWDDDLDRFATDNDGFMDRIHDVINEYDADVAVLIFDRPGEDCGQVSEIGPDNENAFAVVQWDCATNNISFAHEVGHLYGCRHNIEEDDEDDPWSYQHGYYEDGLWRTVMSYYDSSYCPNGCSRIEYFSNPNVNHPGDKKAMGTADEANNARVLRNTRQTLAGFQNYTENMLLSNQTIEDGEYADAFGVSTVETQPDKEYVIEGNATVNFRAGDRIKLTNGFHARRSSSFSAIIE